MAFYVIIQAGFLPWNDQLPVHQVPDSPLEVFLPRPTKQLIVHKLVSRFCIMMFVGRDKRSVWNRMVLGQFRTNLHKFSIYNFHKLLLLRTAHDNVLIVYKSSLKYSSLTVFLSEVSANTIPTKGTHFCPCGTV